MTGKSLGALQDGKGATLHIVGLWGLMFGNGSRANPAAAPSGGDANTLYFAAGIAGPDQVESHGLIGTIQPAPALPAASVFNAASLTAQIAPGGFVTIFGSALAATTRTWTTADFANGKLPLQLDGVSVSIDDKPAYPYYVSPNQINVIAPADSANASVAVLVNNNGLLSAPATAQLRAVAPAFFSVGKYAIATHADGSLVGPANVLPGATPAVPGEVIVVYGTGFGQTTPVVDGLVVTSGANLVAAPVITLGDATATLAAAVRSGPGLDQINFTVPALPAGATGIVDVPIRATSGTSTTPTGLFVTVQSGK